MTKPLAKWVTIRYSRLWRKFKDREFTHKQALEYLNEPKHTTLSLVIQELKQNGWIDIAISKKDPKIRLYKLKEPNKAIMELN